MSLENTGSNTRSLQELRGSDYEISDGQPDIIGWDVKNDMDKKIGEVKDLLFDEQSRKVRYIILDLDDNAFDLDEDRKVLVPIGVAQLHEKEDDVILPGVTADQLRSLPEYEKGKTTSDIESKIRSIFGGVGGAALAGSGTNHDDSFYNHEHFNDDNLYSRRGTGNTEDSTTIPVIQEELEVGKREVEKGGVRLRTRIVENNVNENVTLREEKVHVERTPVDRPVTAADLNTDKVIEVTEKAEVPVVAKEARVVEEISLNKEVTENEEVIRDTVRSTDVDIERTDADTITNSGTGSGSGTTGTGTNSTNTL